MAKISKGWAFVGAGSQAAAGNDKDIQFNNNENLSGSHLLQTDGSGSLSASAGITGSAFKTDGMVSASTFHGSGKYITGVTASAISSSDGPLYSIQYRFNNPNGRELSGSHGFTFNPTTSPRLLTLGGGYRNARLSASAGITGSALKIGDAAGPGMISGSALHGTTLTAVGITGSDAKISGIASGSAINAGVLTAVGVTGSDAKISGIVSGTTLQGTTLRLGNGSIESNWPNSQLAITSSGDMTLEVGGMDLFFKQSRKTMGKIARSSASEFEISGAADATGGVRISSPIGEKLYLEAAEALGTVAVEGVLSASVGITGSAFKTDGAISGSHVYATWITASSTISASSFHGDGSQLIGVAQGGPASLATGSSRLAFSLATGVLTLSGSITASNGITGSAFKTDGAISGSHVYATWITASSTISASSFHGDGSQLIGVSSGPAALATGSARLSFGTDTGILTLSGSITASNGITGSAFKTDGRISAGAINLSPTTGSKAGPTSYLVLDTNNKVVLTAGGEAGPAGEGSIFTTPNGSTAYTTSSVQIGGSGTPTHPLEVIGLISASAGLTGSALKVAGAISGSIIYGDGSQLIGVSSGPASLASGSAKLNFDTSGGELSGSGPLKIGGAARFASTLAVTGAVSSSADGRFLALDLDSTANVLTKTTLGSTVVNSSLTSVGTLVGVTSSSPIVANGGVQTTDLSSSGRAYLGGAGSLAIGGTNVLTKTTLGSSVVGSSLTSVGTLVGVTSSSPIYANAGLNAAGHVSASGDLSARQISAHGEIAITGTHDLRLDYGGEGDSGIYIGASRVLTRTDLGSTVLASSLTSVGTLVGLTSSSPVVANGGVKATTVSASTAVYAGESRFELQPSFGAYANSNQTTTAGVFMHVSANVEDYDIGGGYNTTTCVYTAPKTGTYFLTATTRLDSVNAGGYVWTKIVTTDKDYFGDLWNEDDDSTGYGSPAISIITHMTAGDTAKVYVFSSNLTANTSTSSPGYVMFQGHMLG